MHQPQENLSASNPVVSTPNKQKDDATRLHGLTKAPGEKYVPISIRLHPQVLAWAKAEAKKRGVGYQSVINEALLEMTAT